MTDASDTQKDRHPTQDKIDLAIADFVKAADVLTNESFHGNIHLAICEGIAAMDPFIGDKAPVFFTYTFYAHLYAAQMYAVKLFDKHSDAFTVYKFLAMARGRSSKFRNGDEKRILAYLAKAEEVILELQPTIDTLRARRNDFLAHLSAEFAFTPELLNDGKLTMPQIREVLYEGGNIVNSLLRLWNNSSNQIIETHADDYKRILSLANKQIWADILAHEAEFAKYGAHAPLPHPRDPP